MMREVLTTASSGAVPKHEGPCLAEISICPGKAEKIHTYGPDIAEISQVLRCKAYFSTSLLGVARKKMDTLQVMSAHFDQDEFWNPIIYSLPQTGSVELTSSYAIASIDVDFPFGTARPHRNSSSQVIRPNQLDLWTSPDHMWPTVEPIASPVIKPAKVPLPPDPRPPTQRKPRKPPSGEALERRRQQNRAAQLAFRERSKRQMEELRQELALCVEFNWKMQDSVRALLGRAGGLKSDLEAILALKMPITSLDAASTGDQGRSAESRSGSPQSDSSVNVEG